MCQSRHADRSAVRLQATIRSVLSRHYLALTAADTSGNVQGVFSGVLTMHSFESRMGNAVSDPGTRGWLVAILELGAWLGVLVTGYLADKLSRKYTIVLGKSRRS